MKKRWTFELIVDTRFMDNEGTILNSSRQLELQSSDEATEQVRHWLKALFENEPIEVKLMKFEARRVE